jgi:hypothetical protein
MFVTKFGTPRNTWVSIHTILNTKLPLIACVWVRGCCSTHVLISYITVVHAHCAFLCRQFNQPTPRDRALLRSQLVWSRNSSPSMQIVHSPRPESNESSPISSHTVSLKSVLILSFKLRLSLPSDATFIPFLPLQFSMHFSSLPLVFSFV